MPSELSRQSYPRWGQGPPAETVADGFIGAATAFALVGDWSDAASTGAIALVLMVWGLWRYG